ncbi:hypothetical protein [Mangrovicoccus algicola]|uniref:hypothetical protein n=1 Tax=Mangrovicoccus algicola TaxID=2771008 RepID=UPI0038B3DC26
MISGWKRRAIDNMAIGARAASEPLILAAEIEKLHARIGHLVIERDAPQRFRGPAGATVAASMSEASSLIPGTGVRSR